MNDRDTDVDAAASPSADERRRMVADAAYFRALNRGFEGGSPEEDWYAAEREIDAVLAAKPQRERDLEAYLALRGRVAELLGDVGDLVDTVEIGRLMARAGRELRESGRDVGGAVSRASQALKSELAHAVNSVESALQTASARTPEIFAAWRARGEVFLEQAAAAIRNWLHEIGVRAGPYRAGDMTFAGTLACTRCGAQVVLHSAGHVPPCPACGHGVLRRVDR